MTIQVLTGARIFDGAVLQDGKAVVVEGARIIALVDAGALLVGAQVVRLNGGILAPGLVDVQVNGGGGLLFNDSPDMDTLRCMASAHARLGATTILPTLITDTPDRVAAAVGAVRAALDQGVPGIGGLHLEGPHLARSRKGAHDGDLIRPMAAEDLAVLQDAARDLPTLVVTLAPESVTPDQIAALVSAGAVVSLGHSDCSHAQVTAAVAAGASMVTHLFNAMSPLGSREPGLVGAALGAGALHAGLIADLHHVHGQTLLLALRAKVGPGQIFLVSDAMACAGVELPEFVLTGQRVFRQGGRLALADGTLAGADLDLPQALRNLIGLGVPLDNALAMATAAPAAAIGRTDLGHIKVGGGADLVHLDDHMALQAVWQGGTSLRLG